MLATATLLATTTTTTTVWAAPSPFHSKRQNIGVTPMDPASAFAAPPMDPASAFASPPMGPSALASGVNLPPSPLMNSPDLGAGPLPSSPSPLPPTPQILPQQDIQIASETNVVPTTGVFPQLIFQPAIQLFDPLVSSYPSFGSIMATGIQGSGLLSNAGPFMGAAGAAPFMGMLPGGGGGIAAQPPLPPGVVGGGGPPVGMFKKRQLESGLGGVAAGSIGATGAGRGIVGTPSGISTDMLIQPIVTIQPHALQPVPVPVSQPYSYPVPVSTPSPWFGSRRDGAGACKWGGGGCWGCCNDNGGWGKWSPSGCDQCGGWGNRGR
ncbi:hypothetical protein BGX34_008280 [Mortierella sp. NVP85]|nr:hypothetical protein BGX34_008280 [Mortierella sp. NVP85]